MIENGIYNLRKRNPRYSMPVKVIEVGADYIEYAFYAWSAKKYQTAVMDIVDFKERTTYSGIADLELSKCIEYAQVQDARRPKKK